MSGIIAGLLLTTAAGLATAVGSIYVFFAKTTNKKFLGVSLGFSAGVMLYISLAQILPEAKEALEEPFGHSHGPMIAVAAFFGGILLIILFEKLFVKEHHHHVHGEEEKGELQWTGIAMILAIVIHNIPEGIALFLTSAEDISLGIPLALSVALHNIPIGIAISIPVLYATKSKGKAFSASLLAGMSLPAFGILGYLILAPFMSEAVSGILLAAVAGIMVYVSLDELLPSAREYADHHLSIYGAIGGMAVMAVSMLLIHSH